MRHFNRLCGTAFLRLLDGFPARPGVPPVQKTGTIEADDYVIEKLAFESFPGYFVSALLYRPKKYRLPVPGVLSPCGHSTTGKAAEAYQILHINLAKRGYVVLTYDPVGQGERSQFWDRQESPVALQSELRRTCRSGQSALPARHQPGPLSDLGRDAWPGLPEFSLPKSTRRRSVVSATRVAARSPPTSLRSIRASRSPRSVAISRRYAAGWPTGLRRPLADPEQDIFGFVSEGIDHAGLLAMIAPRPRLLGTARFDFFPIEGARESFAEARRLYQVAGAGDQIERVEAAEKHGLSAPLRLAVYDWFGRWLAGNKVTGRVAEVPVTPRVASQLTVCPQGQVSLTFGSRPFLPLALEQFDGEKTPERSSLRQLLRLDPELADPAITEIAAGSRRIP